MTLTRSALRIARAAAALLALGLAQGAGAAVIHMDVGATDLSNDRLAPTALTLGLGINSIIATSQIGDLEYFKVTVGAGQALESIFLESYSGSDIAFIAVQAGSQFTQPASGTNVTALLGWTHFGPGFGGATGDILDDIGRGSGAIGFLPPLGAGTYTFWSQQTGSAVTYRLDLLLVPEPSSALFLALGLGVVAWAGRRRLRVS